MHQQSLEVLDLGKRLKCGQVFIWNDYDSLTCAVECTLCEDRPSCSLSEFLEHIQVWHQEDWKHDDDDDTEKFHEMRGSGEETDCESKYVTDDIPAHPISNVVQPFEEVLIEIDENEENEFNFSNEEGNFSDKDSSSFEDVTNKYEQFAETASGNDVTAVALSNTTKNVELTIDDLAFKNLNIQCAEIDTTNTTFENDFKLWCQQQQRSKEIQLKRAHSEDSGVEKSETSSSRTTSPPLSMTDESDDFQINDKNIKEQILFGLNKPLPKPKLTTAHMEKLIELYQQHPRLWKATHNEYNNTQKCRQSWQEIRQKWNKICNVNLNEIDIRIRLSTLRQRYLKERERREMYKENEKFDAIKYKIPNRFRYYEKLKFLDEQKQEPYTLQRARINREYTKLIESYAHFPILWNKSEDKHKNPELRQQAYNSICTALQLIGINLSIETVRLRLNTLKKRYRLTKIQHLQSRLKGRTFVSDFKHYNEMKFLDKYIAPYVCDVCGSIFRLYDEYQRHLEKEKHYNNKNSSKTTTEIYAIAIELAKQKPLVITSKMEDATIKISDNKLKQTTLDEAPLDETSMTSAENLRFDSCETLEKNSDLHESSSSVETKVDEYLEKSFETLEMTCESQTTSTRKAVVEFDKNSCEVLPESQDVDWNRKDDSDEEIESEMQHQSVEDTVDETLEKTCQTSIKQTAQTVVIESNENFSAVPCKILEQDADVNSKAAEIVVEKIVQHEFVDTHQVVNECFEQEPAEILAYVDEQNIVTPLQWSNGVPIFIMNPVIKLAQCDEIESQTDFTTNLNSDEQYTTINYAKEDHTKKVYTNLVNVYVDGSEPLSDSFDSLQQPNDLQNTENYFTIVKPINEEEIITPKTYLTTVQPKITIQKPTRSTLTNHEFLARCNQPSYAAEDGRKCDFNPEHSAKFRSHKNQISTKLTNELAVKAVCTSSLQIQSQSGISNESPAFVVENKLANFTNKTFSSSSSIEINLNSSNKIETLVELPDSTSNRKAPLEITEVQILKPIEPLKRISTNSKNELSLGNSNMRTRSSQALVANITSDQIDFGSDLDPNEPKCSTKKRMPYTLTRLTEPQGYKLIELYRLHPQLWNPEHPNFDSRRHKRISWRLLATQFNSSFYLNYNWLQVQRKMMDYIKYYRREQRRIKTTPNVPKWQFFEKLKFLDEVNANITGLQKRIQQRKETLQIIEIYKGHPQLWDTEHGQYSKRNQRQLQIAMMCSRLQEVHNITIVPAKLKQILLELRYNYRTTKLARIEAEKRNEAFEPASRFEFYNELQFLEPHLPPFNCEKCKIEFKCFSEFSTHCKKEHKQQQRNQCPLLANDIDNNTLDNVCHICGIKFTLRQNLVQHLHRHYCERSLECTDCGKKFFTKTTLEEHQRTHSRIPAVICPECGRTFFNTSKLNQHLKRHRNQRDYPCDQCDKAFYSAFERERHVRRHLNIRDKICPVCGKSFVAGSGYYTHIKLHNKTKEYSCVICKREFAQYAGLYKHKKKYHP